MYSKNLLQCGQSIGYRRFLHMPWKLLLQLINHLMLTYIIKQGTSYFCLTQSTMLYLQAYTCVLKYKSENL